MTSYYSSGNGVWPAIRSVLIGIGFLILGLAAVKVLFWGVDILLTVLSFIPDLWGAVFGGVTSSGHGFFSCILRFIYFLLDSLWAYGGALVIIYLGYINILKNRTWWSITSQVVLTLVFTFFVIFTFDPRVAAGLPSFFAAPFLFLQDTCHFALKAHSNILEHVVDSGESMGSFYYTSFDIVTIVLGLLSIYLFVSKDDE